VSTSEIATVLAWHDALNSSDVETLLDLSSDDIEIGGPRGATQGLNALRDWATTAGITLEPQRMYAHDGIVVVEQTAARASDPGSTSTVATAFHVSRDRVVSVFRHGDLETALGATDLSEADLVDS
jgi:ketosteroid isomerase-like protein